LKQVTLKPSLTNLNVTRIRNNLNFEKLLNRTSLLERKYSNIFDKIIGDKINSSNFDAKFSIPEKSFNDSQQNISDSYNISKPVLNEPIENVKPPNKQISEKTLLLIKKVHTIFKIFNLYVLFLSCPLFKVYD